MDYVEVLYGKPSTRMPKNPLVLPKIQRPKGRMILVAGPPGSGKTTYVGGKKKRGDLVIDLDKIKSKISGNPLHRSPDDPALLKRALFERNRMIKKFAAESSPDDTAWLISGSPTASERRHWKQSADAEVIVLETGLEELERRIANDESRKGMAEDMLSWAERWWSEYEPEEGETVVKPQDEMN